MRAGTPMRDRDEAARILGVHPGASRAEVDVARRRLARRLHPDTCTPEADAGAMRRVNWAWQVLLADEPPEALHHSSAVTRRATSAPETGPTSAAGGGLAWWVLAAAMALMVATLLAGVLAAGANEAPPVEYPMLQDNLDR